MKRNLRVAVIVALVAVLGLAGCVQQWVPPELPLAPTVPETVPPISPSEPSPPITPSEPLPPSQLVGPQEGEPPIDRTWISPGKVMVGNFHTGATAEWPLQIHNGSDGQTEEMKLVTTEKGETQGSIPLRRVPLSSDVGEISVRSDQAGENPWVESYSAVSNEILVDGLKADATRTLSIEYVGSSIFSVYYRYPDHVGEGYEKPPDVVQDWVIIADCTPVIAPMTTREIMVAVTIPADYGGTLPPQWEFWIGVKDTSQMGSVTTELCERWLVQMRS